LHQSDIGHPSEEQPSARTLPFSKEAFQALYAQSLDAILVIDAESGDILDANPATQRLFGYDNEALRGKHFTVITPSDRAQSQADLLKEATNYQAVSRVQRIRHADGSICPVEVSATVLPWEKGLAIFATLRDVSERAQAEQRLRELNRALRTLSACNQAVIRATDEQELLYDVCRVVVEVGGYRLTWIGYAQQDENKSVRPIAQAGFEDGYLDTLNITWADDERGRGPTGTTIRTGEPAIARDILTDPSFAPWREQAMARGYASSIALPLRIEGRVSGALNVYAAEPDAFDPPEVELLSELADDLAYGVTALHTRAARRQAAEALQESQRRLSHLMAHLPGRPGLDDGVCQ
jgi:PAS domain S-box-containing protein